jgi:HB1, ASXL, restriction endonuclease HTH domain
MWKKSIELATNIKLGTRVRHVEDGVEGRIVWANASAVKIEWDDGEKVTWKRAELGAKGLVVIDPEEATETPQAAEPPAGEPTPAETTETAEEQTIGGLPARPVVRSDGSEVLVTVPPAEEEVAGTAETPEVPAAGATEQATAEAVAPTPDVAPQAPAKKRAKRTPAEPKPARPSALDAAAKVLAEEHRPMNCQELIGVMAMKGYWTSPGGKTPAATLYSAILRELETKGDAARFVKVGKGQFALRPQA